MRKLITIIGVLLVGVLIYTSYATTDIYIFKPQSPYYIGSVKWMKIATDGRLKTLTTSDVTEIVEYQRKTLTALDSNSTPTISGLTQFYSGVEQPAITYFDDGVEGQVIYIKARLDSLFITDSDTLDCGSASLTLDTLSIVSFIYYNPIWTVLSVTNVNTDNN